jgi:hypothetical protein
VEADETYIGGERSGGKLAKRTQDRDAELRGRPKPTGNKTALFTLVERDGRARSFRMANVTADNLRGADRPQRGRSGDSGTTIFRPKQNGKLKIPLPKVPADKPAKPNGKKGKPRRRAKKS